MDAPLLILLALYLLTGPIILLVLILIAMGRNRESLEQIEGLRKQLNELRFKLESLKRRPGIQSALQDEPVGAGEEPPATGDGEPTEKQAVSPSQAAPAFIHGDQRRALQAAKLKADLPAGFAPPPPPVPIEASSAKAAAPKEAAPTPQPPGAPAQEPVPSPTPKEQPWPSPLRAPIPWGRLLDAFGLQPPRPGEAGEAVAAAWWVTRIGMLLGIIAAVFFGIYVSQSSGPWLRLAQLVAVSLAVTGIGLWQERTLKRFGQVLTGGGLALLFFSCYGAAALPALRVIDNPALGALVQALGVAGILGFALWRRSEPVGTMAIGFGYVACWFAQVHGLQPWPLIGLWVLAATACLLQFRFQWHTARAVALAGSYTGLSLLIIFVWPHNPPAAATLLLWLLALAAVFGLSCQRSLSPRAGTMPPFAAGWCVVNSSAASALGLLAFLNFHPAHAHWFFLSFTLLWLLLAWLLRITDDGSESYKAATAIVFPALILKASALLCLWIIDTLGGALQAPAVALQGFGLLWLLRRERSRWLPAAIAVLLTVVMPILAWLEWRTVALAPFAGGAVLPPWPQPAHLGGAVAALLALAILTLTQRWLLLDHITEKHRRNGLWWARLVFGGMLAACFLVPWQGPAQGFALLGVVGALVAVGLKTRAGGMLDPLPSAAIAWAPVYLLILTGRLGDLHHLPALALVVSALLVLVLAHAMLDRLAELDPDHASPGEIHPRQVADLGLTALALGTIWHSLQATVQGPAGAPDTRLIWWLAAAALSVLILARQLPRPAADPFSKVPFATGLAAPVAQITVALCLYPCLMAALLAHKAFSPGHLPWIVATGGSMALLAMTLGTNRARPLWWSAVALWSAGFLWQWQAFAAAPEGAGFVVVALNPLLLATAAWAGVILAARHLPPPSEEPPGDLLPPPHPLTMLQSVLHLAAVAILIQQVLWHFSFGWQLAAATGLALVWLAMGRVGGTRRWLAAEAAALPVLLLAGLHKMPLFLDGAMSASAMPQPDGLPRLIDHAAGWTAAGLLLLLLPSIRDRFKFLRTGTAPATVFGRSVMNWLCAAGVATGWWFAVSQLVTPGWQLPGLTLAALAAAICHRSLRSEGMHVFSLLLTGAALIGSAHLLPAAFNRGTLPTGMPWQSPLLAAAILAAAGAVLLGRIRRIHRKQPPTPADPALETDPCLKNPLLEPGQPRIAYAWIHAVAALVLAFVGWALAPPPFDNMLTVCWGGTAVLMWLLGLGVRLRAFRMTGLIGFAICILRMFIVDIHQTLERIIAFAVVAVVLLVTGYLYSRLRDWIDPPDPREMAEGGE